MNNNYLQNNNIGLIKEEALNEYEKINKILNPTTPNSRYTLPIETNDEIDEFIKQFTLLIKDFKSKYIKKSGRGRRFGNTNATSFGSAIFALDSLSTVLGKPQTIIGGAIKLLSKKNKRSRRKTKRKTHSRKHV